jgi:outer membrane protein assembly factor BamB
MNHSLKLIGFVSLTLACMALLSPDSKTVNWPCFRGENNMTAEGNSLPDQWSNDSNVAWTYDIEGEGWSSPVIWGNKAFVLSVVSEMITERPAETKPPQPAPSGQAQSSQAPPPPPPPGQDTAFKQDIYRWEVICLDMNTGAELWKRVALKGHPRTSKHRMNNYASETPVTDGHRVYAWFGMHGLYCYDMDGNIVWQKDLGNYNTLKGWGTGSSPVLHNNTLYIQADNEDQSFIIALDASTGNEKWRAAREEKTNYSTPVIWENKERTELVVGGKKAMGYDPVSGKNLWQLSIGGDMCIPSAVYDKELLYISNTGQRVQGKFFAVKSGAEGDITPPESDTASAGVKWSIANAGQGNPSPLLYKGLLYLISSRGGEFTCIEPATGKIIYKEKIDGVGAVWASPWAYNEKVFFYDETGKTHVIQAGPLYKHLDINRLNDKFWASAAIAGDAVLFRGIDKLYCVKK